MLQSPGGRFGEITRERACEGWQSQRVLSGCQLFNWFFHSGIYFKAMERGWVHLFHENV